jgi:hypothetical protein
LVELTPPPHIWTSILFAIINSINNPHLLTTDPFLDLCWKQILNSRIELAKSYEGTQSRLSKSAEMERASWWQSTRQWTSTQVLCSSGCFTGLPDAKISYSKFIRPFPRPQNPRHTNGNLWSSLMNTRPYKLVYRLPPALEAKREEHVVNAGSRS